MAIVEIHCRFVTASIGRHVGSVAEIGAPNVSVIPLRKDREAAGKVVPTTEGGSNSDAERKIWTTAAARHIDTQRRILHFNVSRHPTGAWIVQQLREAFPYERATEFLLLDHDSNYGTEVPVAIRSMDIKAVRTAVGCPGQNGVAERWVGSCRRELLDHVLAISESHLKRLLSSYVEYYHQDRTHCALQKQTPECN